MDPLTQFVLTPAGCDDPAMAIAASRAGAVGVFNAEFHADAQRVLAALGRLASHARNDWGVIVGPSAADWLPDAVDRFQAKGLKWLIVDQHEAGKYAEIIDKFRSAEGLALLQVRTAENALKGVAENFDGYVAKGSEASGRIGDTSTLTLVRDLKGLKLAPVFALGDCGIVTAAACIAEGAAGIVLDSQLLLLRESPVSEIVSRELDRPRGYATVVAGDAQAGTGVRLLHTAAASDFVARSGDDPVDAVASRRMWTGNSVDILPAGDGLRFARDWKKSFGTVSGVLRALSRALPAHLQDAQNVLAEESSLAVSQGTRFGLVQVPSEADEKYLKQAVALAEEGVLPMLSLAGVTESSVGALIAEFAKAVGERPWGVGIDGESGAGLLAAQIQACKAHTPHCAWLLNGRPDQALAIERAGLPCYLPVADRSMLRLQARQGARRFVFGDHKDASRHGGLSRWEVLSNTLLAELKGADLRSCHVLFSGNLDDAAAAAAAATAAVPLQQLGVSVGIAIDSSKAQRRAMSRWVNELTEGAVEQLRSRLAEVRPPRRKKRTRAKPSDIAVVGIGSVLPHARHTREFWENILDSVDAVTEVPPHRWDWRIYFDENRDAPDKIYSRWGGFLDDMPFNPLRYGIPPTALRSLDPLQLMALEVLRQTLDDAGYGDRDFDRERVSLILGASGGAGDVGAQYAVRSEMPRFMGEMDPGAADRLPKWTEDTFAGILLNVAAGRAANRFDFGGVNFTVDAACASSLTAVYHGVNELESGRSDMAIVGGIDTVQGPFGYLCFSKTQALSPRGRCRTFDKSGDGIVISEGLAMVALKRLGDAERDGDRIYSVIKGAAGSSDGRAKSMTAPHPDGQVRALNRTYQKAGYSPATVGLFEAHGTGTVAGDTAEIETVTRVLAAAGSKPKSAAIGSVKTMIGHTKATAGVAGLIKISLALYHKVLPPHANVDTPIDRIADPDSPLYLLKKPQPWLVHPEHPRRASVSAFGFGGTNFHVTMEEYLGEFLHQGRSAPRERWPAEVLLWRAEDRDGLAAQIEAIAAQGDMDRDFALRDLAYTLARGLPDSGITATLVASTVAGLSARLNALATHIRDPGSNKMPPGAFVGERQPGDAPKLAVVFAGQGSQYPDMLRDVALGTRDIRAVAARADVLLAERTEQSCGMQLSRAIYIDGVYDEAGQNAANKRLTRTNVAQPALGVISAGLWHLFQRMGLEPDMAAGHSYGEYPALYAAGVFGLDDLITISEARGRHIVEAARAHDAELGTMASVRADRKEVERYAAEFADLTVANHNSPTQTILSGSHDSIHAVVKKLNHENIDAQVLPVGAAFHSSFVSAARDALAKSIRKLKVSKMRFPVYSNTTAEPHSDRPATLRKVLSEHLASPVEFVNEIEAMYRDGARIFLGLGPKNVQGSLIGQILGDRPHCVVGVDDQEGGLRGLVSAVGALMSEGVSLDPMALFAGRDCRTVDLSNLNAGSRRPESGPHIWVLNGGAARPASEAPVAPLTIEQIEVEKAARVQVAPSPTETPIETPTIETHIAETPVAAPAPPVPRQMPVRKRPAILREELKMTDKSPPSPQGVAMSPAEGPSNWVMPSDRETVLQMYQETMHQFLRAQENIMMAYLTGESTQPGYQPVRTVAPRPVAAPRRPAMPPRAMPAAAPPPAVRPAAAPTSASAPVTNGVAQSNGAAHTPAPAPVAAAPAPVATPAPAAAPAPAPTPAATKGNGSGNGSAKSAGGGAIEAGGVKTLLLTLVEDRTGYPQEMLDLDQNMEADLGIDSIKRVEIVGALLKALPDGFVPADTDASQELNNQTTLQGMIDWLTKNGAAGESASRPFDLTGEDAIAQSGARLPRFVMQASLAPLTDDIPLADLEPGRYVITRDGEGGVADALAEAVRSAGGTPVMIGAADLCDPARLATVLTATASKQPFRGLLHVAGLAVSNADTESGLSAWRRAAEIDSKGLFRLLQVLANEFRGGGCVVAASALGGCFGRDGASNVLSPQGGATGLLKCMKEEWPAVQFKAVDLDPSLPAADQAGSLLTEWRLPGGRIEVGYPAGQRSIFRSIEAPLEEGEPDPARKPDKDWVVLASGGARGITAEFLHTLAPSGLTLVLIGRTPEPAPEEPESQHLASTAELRRFFLQQAKERGEKLRPVEIEQKVSALLRDREMRANFAELRAAGATISYRVCDVRDEQGMQALFDAIYAEYGRLDGVIHGAGIIEDKLLVDKTDASWCRVFDTKVDSAFLLTRFLRPESLKFVTLFASVAGRYGNSGQTDYAAANEIMNRIAWTLNTRWDGRVKVTAVNWGPWAGTRHGAGMVSDETSRKFAGMGVHLVAPQAGSDMMLDEILRGPLGDAEVIAGAGPWEQRESERGVWTHGVAAGSAVAAAQPLLGDFQRVDGDDGEIRLQFSVDVARHNYLMEHTLDDKPVLPAAVAVELFAESAAALWPEWEVNEISDVRALKGIVLESGSVALEMVARRDSSNASSGFTADMLLRSADGRPLPHYKAVVHLGAEPLETAPYQSTLQPGAAPVDAGQAYRDWLFHGPRFQVIHRLIGVDQRGALADITPGTPQQWLSNESPDSGWLFDPGMVDSAPQMAIVWANVVRGATALPNRFGRVRRFGREPLGPCRMHFLLYQDQLESQVKADVAFVDEQQRVRLFIEQLECASSQALNRLGGGWKGEICV